MLKKTTETPSKFLSRRFSGTNSYVGISVSYSETSRDVPEDGNFHNHGRAKLEILYWTVVPYTGHRVQYVPCCSSFVGRFMQWERRRE